MSIIGRDGSIAVKRQSGPSIFAATISCAPPPAPTTRMCGELLSPSVADSMQAANVDDMEVGSLKRTLSGSRLARCLTATRGDESKHGLEDSVGLLQR